MRDSKDPAGPVLAVTRAVWGAFLGGVRAGGFGGPGPLSALQRAGAELRERFVDLVEIETRRI